MKDIDTIIIPLFIGLSYGIALSVWHFMGWFAYIVLN